MPDGASTSTGRERLLRVAVEHFADHGVTELSLRGLAATLGTSHRMLIYHFGSREGLLAEVVGVVEAQQRDALAALSEAGDPGEAIPRFWSQVLDAARRYGPLFFELSAHAMQGRPHAETLRTTLVDPWLEALTRLLEQTGRDPESARVHARLGLAVARGLLHDVLLTGDTAGTDEAMRAFTATVLAE